jgi:PKD repeat protein
LKKIVSYEWRLGDIVLSDSKKFTKDDFSEGTHRVTLKVTDDKGLTDTDTVVVTISTEDNLKPIANAGGNIFVEFGKNVTFDGSESKDSDGEIVSYEWKEGDKVLSNSVKFTKKDFSKGKHTVTLTVIDNNRATDKDITIINILEHEQTINEIINMDFSLLSKLKINSVVKGNITVKTNGFLILNGVVKESIFIENNSNVLIYGIVSGNIINNGGKLKIYGIVSGQVVKNGGETIIYENAYINGHKYKGSNKRRINGY